MKKSIFFLLFLISAIMYSCVSQIGKDKDEVKALETKFASDNKDIKIAVDLDRSYKKFIRKYPSDTNLPHMLYEDGRINDFPLHKTHEALDQFEAVYSKYPDSRYAPEALLRAAFINETVVMNYDKAKTLYSLFLKTYPNHHLANDARLSLENIGLSPEQQFKKIQAVQDSIKNQKKVIQ